MNIVITGANRGLGLGFVQHYLAEGHNVWACYRSVPDGLDVLAHPKLKTVQWDVTETISNDALQALPINVDLLINNAGIYGGCQDLAGVSSATMMAVFQVDCVGPLNVVQTLLPRLIAGKGCIANLSSKMGSSSDNGSGGSYAYRAAKAALVIVSKSMAIDLAPKGVKVITLHPGWVRTDMTNHGGLIGVDESVVGMTQVIHNIADYELGAFVAFDGQVIPF